MKALRPGTSATSSPRASERLAAIAERQYGLVTGTQARAQGFDRRAIDWMLESRSWVSLCRGIYRVAGAPRTWRQTALAALLAKGPDSALSHLSAAFLLQLDGVPREPTPVEATITRKQAASLVGVVFHRSRVAFQPVHVGRFRVTSVARTLVDLSSVLTPLDLEIALDSAQRRFHRVDEWLNRHLAQRKRLGHGVAVLRELLALRTGGATDSPLEVKVRRSLRRSGLPRPLLQHEVLDGGERVMRVDFAWPHHMVALHADGYRWHHHREHFERDARQRSRLAALGWSSIVVTHLGLEQPEWLDDLRRALDQRSPQLPLPLDPPGGPHRPR